MKEKKAAAAVNAKNSNNIIRQAIEDVAKTIEEDITRTVKVGHSPTNALGVLRSISLITEIRARLSEEHGWTSDNPRGASITVSPCKKKALIIRSGNKHTGNPNVSADQVSTNNRKISKTARAIHEGQSELTLTGGTELQILLYKRDKNEMRIEISNINELDGETIKSLSNRDCYSIDIDGVFSKKQASAPRQQEFIVEEFEVKRKG